MRRSIGVRMGWVAALVAGFTWLLVWAHQARAHGTTQVNVAGVRPRRRRRLPIWIGIVLLAGAATTLYLTPVLPAPDIAWLVLGVYLWYAGRSRIDASPGSTGAGPLRD